MAILRQAQDDVTLIRRSGIEECSHIGQGSE